MAYSKYGTPKPPKRTLTLKEAADLARERGLIGDYYALDEDAKASLRNLLERTKWRQSRSSLEKGHNLSYAFHQALKRQLPKSKDPSSLRQKLYKAESISADAFDRQRKAYDGATPTEWLEIADEFDVAGEAFEDANDMYRARKHRQTAKLIRDRFPQRDARMQRRGSSMRRRSSRYRTRRDPVRRGPRGGQKLTVRQREIVSKKIRIMIKEGYPRRVAIAAAMRYAGVKRPRSLKTKRLSAGEHRQLMRARRKDPKLRSRKARKSR